MPKATCPTNPAHNRFVTTAHYMHDIVVDNDGDFVDDKGPIEETHGPDSGNIWACLECDAEATVEP